MFRSISSSILDWELGNLNLRPFSVDLIFHDDKISNQGYHFSFHPLFDLITLFPILTNTLLRHCYFVG